MPLYSLKTSKLLLVSLILYANILGLEAAAEPDQVIEFFRHGARTPRSNYDKQWSKSELKQLTPVGMVQQYNLGKTLAARYPNLIASGYNPDDVYVLSDTSPRCIESAMVQLLSLFRGKTSTLLESPQQELQDNLTAKYTPLLSDDEVNRGEYVPVKVDVVELKSTEQLIFAGRDPKFCRNLKIYQNASKISTEMSTGWEIFQDPVQEANSYLPESQKIKNMDNLMWAHDTIISDKYDNRTSPGGITDEDLIERLNYGQAYYQYILEERLEIQKELTSFNVLKAIIDPMESFRQGNNPKKLVLLSGHDINIIAVLSAFGIMSAECLLANYKDYELGEDLSYPNCQFPEFASNIIFEFYNQTTNPYVKFYYNDVLVPLCGEDESCSYDDFVALAQTSSGNNNLATWNEKCGNTRTVDVTVAVAAQEETDRYFHEEPLADWMRTIILCGVSACTFVGIGAWILFRKKSDMKIKFESEDSPA
jgi:hypothetical protein